MKSGEGNTRSGLLLKKQQLREWEAIATCNLERLETKKSCALSGDTDISQRAT